MRIQSVTWQGIVFVLMATAATGANAASPDGRLLAAQCAQCHGTNGSGPGFENIAGESSRELFNELREMKVRPVESIMDRHARGYTDEQLELLADYLATLPSGGD